jgi:hypothetical protein
MNQWYSLRPPELLNAISVVAEALLPVFLHGEDEGGEYLDVRLTPPEGDPLEGKVVSIRYYIKESGYPGTLHKENPELDAAIRRRLPDILAYLQEWAEPDELSDYVPVNSRFAVSKNGNLVLHFETMRGRKRQRTLKDMDIPKWVSRRLKGQ